MLQVILPHKTVPEIMDIVYALRAQGLIQGIHFDFAYNNPTYDPITGHAIMERHTVFTFHEEKYATLFSLKYI